MTHLQTSYLQNALGKPNAATKPAVQLTLPQIMLALKSLGATTARITMHASLSNGNEVHEEVTVALRYFFIPQPEPSNNTSPDSVDG